MLTVVRDVCGQASLDFDPDWREAAADAIEELAMEEARERVPFPMGPPLSRSDAYGLQGLPFELGGLQVWV